MSKEQLGEIKARYHLLKRNGYDLGAWDEPFSWLIEQAERVQELEEDCEYLSHHYGLEAEKNKRYREAIIEALHGLKTLPSVAPRLYLISILDKTLEGEE